jgi:hypothetical protein
MHLEDSNSIRGLESNVYFKAILGFLIAENATIILPVQK